MKKRIKIDVSLLIFVIVFTGILLQFPALYVSDQGFDNVMDFLGILFVLKGVYLRMAARGVKKAYSHQGAGLIVSGLYRYMRNPMYLGSFLIGCGFVLLVWPWWSIFIFAGMFYLRFLRQITLEERFLREQFGRDYVEYCEQTPRLFPRWGMFKELNVTRIFPLKETWSTKEKYGLFFWPLLAVLLETLQEQFLFQAIDIGKTLVIVAISASLFAAHVGLHYKFGR